MLHEALHEAARGLAGHGEYERADLVHSHMEGDGILHLKRWKEVSAFSSTGSRTK